MTAPTLRGTSVSAAGSSSSHTVTIPAGAQVGDWVYIWTSHNHSTDTAHQRMPAGWTAVDRVVYSSSFCSEHWSRQVVAGGSGTAGGAGSTVTITFGGAARRGFFLACYNLPVEARASMTAPGTSTTNTAPTVVTVADDSTALEVWCERSSTASTSVTQPSGFTTLASVFNSGSGSASIAAADNTSATNPGDTVGGGTWTADVANPGVIIWTMAVEGASTGYTGSVALSGSGALTVTGVAQTPGVVNLTGSGTLTVTGGPAVTGAVALGGTGTLAVTSDTPVDLLTYPIYIAHRGGPNITDRAENTVTAYALSIANDHPAMLLETDCAGLATGGGYTAEQRIALTHEGDDLSTNSRTVQSDGTTVVTGLSRDKTVAQWDSYLITQRSGISGTPKPASRWYTGDSGNPGLADLLLANPTKIAVPEVKEPEALTPLIDSILARNLAGRTIVQSFDYTEAQTIAAAGLNALYLVSAFTSPTAAAIYASGIRFVGIDRTNVNLASLTTTAHAAGLKVIAYTVNSTTNQATALAAGVDGMFTDRPDLVNAGGYGTVNLTGGGTLTVSGAPGVSRTVALSGSGTLTVAGTPSTSRTVSLTGSGTLAVTGEASGSGMGTVQLGGTGTLAVDGVPSFTGAVSLEGTGTLAVAAIVAVAQAVNLAGSGTLTVAGTAGGAARNLTFAGRVSQRISIVGRVED